MHLLIVAGEQVQVVLVDVDHLHTLVFALEREWPAGLHGLKEVYRALPVAMVQLGRTDERIEPRRIDLVLDALGDDLNVVFGACSAPPRSSHASKLLRSVLTRAEVAERLM